MKRALIVVSVLVSEMALAQGILPSWMRRGGDTPPPSSGQKMDQRQASIPAFKASIESSPVSQKGEVVLQVRSSGNGVASVQINGVEMGGFKDSSKEYRRFVPVGDSVLEVVVTDEFGQIEKRSVQVSRASPQLAGQKVPAYQPVITASSVAPNGEVNINIEVPQNITASVLMNNFEIGGFSESSKRIKRFVPPGESSVVLKLTDEFGQTFTKEFAFNRPRDAAAAELAMGSPTDAGQSSKLPPRAKKVAALVIGNSNYKTSPLANPKNDASAISAKLKGMGYNVKTLIDADRKELLKGLNQFREMAEKSDVGIFYYAGHGVQVAGTNYILPVDFDLVHGIASVQFDGVAINQVLDNFVPTETKLAFLDACRDNPLSRSLAKTRNAGALGLAPMESVSGTLISFATKDGAVALDGEGKHSPYTQALLTHLDDRVDVSVMLRRVRQKVIDTTRGKQMPWDYGSLVGDELVLGRESR